MSQIINLNSEVTMSSLDFMNEVINPARLLSGEKEVRPSDFHARVRDELDENLNYENFVVGKTGHKTHYTTLNMDQMLLVGMRESKAVRRSVLAMLKKLSNNINDLQIMVDAQRMMLDALQCNDHAEELQAARRKQFNAEAEYSEVTRRLMLAIDAIDKLKQKSKEPELKQILTDMILSWNWTSEARQEKYDAHNRAELTEQKHGALVYAIQKSSEALGVQIADMRLSLENPLSLLMKK